jgi:hypothetical protein
MIEIFKTNVQYPIIAKEISAALYQQLVHPKVSFDLDDCDRVLRIESEHRY